MTVDEFLLWAEGREGRWELHDGEPVMISSAEPVMISLERAGHVRTKFSAAKALERALATAGMACEVFADGMAVRIDARTTFEPDASVVCGPRSADETIAIDKPIIAVEVLSPSTAAIDHGRKLSGYFSLPSVQHYLILDPTGEPLFITSVAAAMSSRRASSPKGRSSSIRQDLRLRSSRCSLRPDRR